MLPDDMPRVRLRKTAANGAYVKYGDKPIICISIPGIVQANGAVAPMFCLKDDDVPLPCIWDEFRKPEIYDATPNNHVAHGGVP